MSSEERDIILQMLAEGKVSPSEAGDLLDALEIKGSAQPAFSTGLEQTKQGGRVDPSLAGRGLLIHVRDGEETRTKVHIPLGLALTAGKFIPKRAQEALQEYGLDLGQILETIAKGDQRGEIVDVRDGETRVEIAVI